MFPGAQTLPDGQLTHENEPSHPLLFMVSLETNLKVKQPVLEVIAPGKDVPVSVAING